MRKILGIDPGIKGALSVIDEQFNFISADHMPAIKLDNGKTRVDAASVKKIIDASCADLIVLESVWARKGEGPVGAFSFGDGFGVVRALAETSGIPVILVTPQKWQGFQQLTGLSKEQIGEIAFNVFQAEAIYGPRGGLRDGISDSLMIAKYGVRHLE